MSELPHERRAKTFDNCLSNSVKNNLSSKGYIGNMKSDIFCSLAQKEILCCSEKMEASNPMFYDLNVIHMSSLGAVVTKQRYYCTPGVWESIPAGVARPV